MVGDRANFINEMPTTSRKQRDVLDVPLDLDPTAGNQSLQVNRAIRGAILDGRLGAGLRLPSSRALAQQLGVRRNAIIAAYEHLLSDGFVETRTGAGTYVAPIPLPRHQAPAVLRADRWQTAARRPFALGHTHADRRLLGQFGAALRRQTTRADRLSLGYGDPRGSPALREQIAAYLSANRGLRCDPDSILVTSGTQHAVRLCALALLGRGDLVWVEDPGYPAARRTFEASGLVPVAVRVDADGLDIAAGRHIAPSARAVYVTPSHQFPTGVTMSMPRRVALLSWAGEQQSFIFEDDYDSEFRYAGPPLTALAGLGRGDAVIYLGTFSKTLFPGLRLAYAVLPPKALDRVVAARAGFDRFPSSLLDGAVTDLMAEGVLLSHVRRMRSRYRAARDALASMLERAAGGALEITVPSQGLHLVAYLPARLASDAGQRIREKAGVDALLLSETRSLGGDGREGFVLGFSGFDMEELTAAAQRLGEAAAQVAKSESTSLDREGSRPVPAPRQSKGRLPCR
jgi:GntR family transcriptional regulator/MocR family aminotransferase